tara:strand:- start:936 stop:1220 length:285 start_codon:yes stop_codon:yes gene_type:complete
MTIIPSMFLSVKLLVAYGCMVGKDVLWTVTIAIAAIGQPKMVVMLTMYIVVVVTKDFWEVEEEKVPAIYHLSHPSSEVFPPNVAILMIVLVVKR